MYLIIYKKFYTILFIELGWVMNNKLDTIKKISQVNIAVVIPAYRTANVIVKVLEEIPDYVNQIFVVDDCSPDNLKEVVEKFSKNSKKIKLISLDENRGVGGATIVGYLEAVNGGADIIIKIDSDHQMDLDYLPAILEPLLNKKADYVKGNRFMYLQERNEMPLIRRIGNITLSLLSKIASGYWNIFDCTNGYTAIWSDVIQRIPLERLHQRYFFETSMLVELGLINAVVKDVYVPINYKDHQSSLSEIDTVIRFPGLLIKAIFRRILLRYFFRDFTAFSIFLIFGTILSLFGTIFGITMWLRSFYTGILTTTGTVMIAALPILIGWQFLMQSVVIDIQSVPKECIHEQINTK